MHMKEQSPVFGTTTPAHRRAELERLEAQVAEWTALIGQYRARARRAEHQARVELERITDDLQRQRNEASAQVMRLKSSTEAEWEHDKAELEQAWQAIRLSFRESKGRC